MRSTEIVEWNAVAAEDVLQLAQARSLDVIEHVFGAAMPAVSGCLRGLFVAAPGHDLICSDYSSIEAVVLAEMAGCQWRREVFQTHGRIYEVSAAKITGRTLEEYIEYKGRTGQHHPDRKLGKVAELASGYQGWIGAWKAFGADEFMSDDEVKHAILAWRAASPEIPELWGGQPNWRRPEYWGIEGCAVQAVLNPGRAYSYRMFTWWCADDILYCQLPSGRRLTYHRPRLEPSERDSAQWALSYEGWNTNPKNGPPGWIRIRTWGGRLVENLCQAVARDILAFAVVNLELRGYPVVLHVYDEVVSEVRERFGSVEEFEAIMMTLPDWAAGWPIRAKGGWRAKRYRK